MQLRSLVLLGGMLVNSLASAAMVEVTFDVTIREQGVGQLVGAGWDFVPDDGVVPQTFSLIARFDAANSHLAAQYLAESPFSSSMNWSFASSSLSQSPYTQAFRDKVPALNPTLDISVARLVDEYEGEGLVRDDYFNATAYAENFSNPLAIAYYGQDLALRLSQGAGSQDETDPPRGDELVDLLRASIGKTYFGDYMEFYVNLLRQPVLGENGFVIGYQNVAIDARYLVGDVTIRSVQAVPLPAVGLWMQLAAASSIALVSLRRRVKARFS